jgi:hypothetical protein
MTTKWTPNEQTRREMEEVGFLTNKYCLVENWKKSDETFNDDKHTDFEEWKGMKFYGKSKFSKKHIRPLPILTRFKDNDSKLGVFGHDTILTNEDKRIMVVSDGHGSRRGNRLSNCNIGDYERKKWKFFRNSEHHTSTSIET